MRGWWLACLLLISLLSGCFGDDGPDRAVTPPDVGYDASQVRVSDVATHDATITSFDGTELAAVIYEPITADLVDGEAPTFPVVVFVHPFGAGKETYENLPLGLQQGEPGEPVNVMDDFARAGMISVSYDTRGFFESGGTSTIAGPAEMADLDAVIDHVESNFHASGRVGVTGISYGGGHSFLAWADNPRVDTVVPVNGWVDLYDALMPGNVPKVEWGAAFGATAAAETGGVRLSDDVSRWLTDAFLRQDLDDLETELDLRSILTGAGVDKPLFTCQGLQESAFHQSHRAWATTDAFVRAYYFTGGHNTLDAECWTKARQWFQFFLLGLDTEVDAWPLIDTADIDGEGRSTFSSLASIVDEARYLTGGALAASPAPNATFTISQRLISNPLTEPSVFWDSIGRPFENLPEQFRQDPTAVTFTTGASQASRVVLGAPMLRLDATNETVEGPWQVVVTAYHSSDGNLRLLGRSAHAVIDEGDHDGPSAWIELPWTHVDLAPGDAIVLKVASNDPTIFAPLQANYNVDFLGTSQLSLPFFSPDQSE